ncbi:MAG: DUF192 domain-containing protein [Alphaproteobacteria bacterium]|nr:DUF192 domain-containing protein [Alphaproteobacteria bacterium]
MRNILKIFAITVMLFGCNQNDNLSKMVIETSDGSATYYVESALTQEEMSKGLMDRKELRADSGMIFYTGRTQEIAMWMKDTYVPLDILFVNKNGKILWIYENAEPLSTKLIKPEVSEPMAAVIEINAGDVAKHKIKVGDIVHHKLLEN